MNHFPPLDRWFEIRTDCPNPHHYTRYDLRVRPGLTPADIDDLASEIALLIARLRLNPREYDIWLHCWNNLAPVPTELLERFRDRFWRGFISTAATKRAGEVPQFDEIALQGHLGELMLYLVQDQLYKERIRAVPRRPKEYSKDSGIDCVELCGSVDVPSSLHYIIWESKGLTANTLGDYPVKIYNQHLHATPKSFAQMVDLLADSYEQGEDTRSRLLSAFVAEMIDDFYARPPSERKCFGGCVTFSSEQFAHPNAFSAFQTRFKSDLAPARHCRQVRLCAIGDMSNIAYQVRCKIWSRLLP